MGFFGVRYWTVLFWLNVILSVAHALRGNNMVFLAIGMALWSKGMVYLLTHPQEN